MNLKIMIALLITSLGFTSLFAEGEDDSMAKVEWSTILTVGYQTPAGVQIGINENMSVPFLTGEGILASNTLHASLGAFVNPVVVGANFNIGFTPLPIFDLYTGLGIGTGWKIDDKTYGIALSEAGADNKTKYTDLTFSRTVLNYNLGGAFQFDLGAVIPGDWNHIVTKSTHTFNYAALSGSDNSTSWVYMGGDGNQNGWTYSGDVFLGYQMPIFLDTVGVLASWSQKLYEPVPTTYGGELMTYGFAFAGNIKFDDKSSLLFALQFGTQKQFVSGTEELYYKNRVIKSEPLLWQFAAFAMQASFKL